MWLQVALLTACALFGGLSAWFALMANRARDACAHSEARLLTQRGRIVGLETAMDALDTRLRKLAGRIYADEYHGNLPAPAPRPQTIDVACENYARAQIDGPTSAAARCECEYCSGMRAQRDAFRTAAVPKTVRAARINGGDNG